MLLCSFDPFLVFHDASLSILTFIITTIMHLCMVDYGWAIRRWFGLWISHFLFSGIFTSPRTPDLNTSSAYLSVSLMHVCG